MGFTQKEKQIIGLIVRFHRKGMPDNEGAEFGSIFRGNYEKINILAASLRLATALNRTRRSRIKSLSTAFVDKSEVNVVIRTQDGSVPEAELLMATRERKNLAKGFGVKVNIFSETPA